MVTPTRGSLIMAVTWWLRYAVEIRDARLESQKTLE